VLLVEERTLKADTEGRKTPFRDSELSVINGNPEEKRLIPRAKRRGFSLGSYSSGKGEPWS